MSQARLIHLAEAAEAYIKMVRSRQASDGSASVSAQRKHDHEQRLARKSLEAEGNGGAV